MDSESLSWLDDKQGSFVLLTRRESPKKNGHILYHTAKDEYIAMLMRTMPCEYVAAFNYEGEIVRLTDIIDTQD
jgi:hypothetical protein